MFYFSVLAMYLLTDDKVDKVTLTLTLTLSLTLTLNSAHMCL